MHSNNILKVIPFILCGPQYIISVDKCHIACSLCVDKSALGPGIGGDFTVEKVKEGTSRFGSTEGDTVIKTDVMYGIKNRPHNLSTNRPIIFISTLTKSHLYPLSQFTICAFSPGPKSIHQLKSLKP